MPSYRRALDLLDTERRLHHAGSAGLGMLPITAGAIMFGPVLIKIIGAAMLLIAGAMTALRWTSRRDRAALADGFKPYTAVPAMPISHRRGGRG